VDCKGEGSNATLLKSLPFGQAKNSDQLANWREFGSAQVAKNVEKQKYYVVCSRFGLPDLGDHPRPV
jgi:hypothetical protein